VKADYLTKKKRIIWESVYLHKLFSTIYFLGEQSPHYGKFEKKSIIKESQGQNS